MTRIVFTISFMLVILTTGCGGSKYVPAITLTQTGPIIDAIAEFHDLYTAYPLLSGKETFGVDAPKMKRIDPSELTRQVENELLKELDAAGLFSRVTRFDPHPDVILSGRITALHEEYRPQLWAQIPDAIPYVGIIAQLLRMKTHVSSGEARLTLFVLKPNGEVLGTYIGKSTFTETFNPTNDVPPGARLNRALSEAVHQIQNEISLDAQLRKLVSRQGSRHSVYPLQTS
ncbi:MAG TPA: hypothetical protein VJT11_08060 [Nitrospiraceae bacterium]|jgi:hypothetical protein|nr:hypothetical protein [Nitrospiraceae bacterium]